MIHYAACWAPVLALVRFAVVAVALFVPTISAAQDLKTYKTVGNWEIFHLGTGSDGACGAYASYSRGTVVMLSVEPATRAVSVTLIHDNWKSVEHGREYPVQLLFDGVRSTGKMNGTVIGSSPGIQGDLTSQGLTRFMNANKMTILYKGEVVASLSLQGTSNMVSELRNCQLAINPKGWPTADNPPDPFRR